MLVYIETCVNDTRFDVDKPQSLPKSPQSLHASLKFQYRVFTYVYISFDISFSGIFLIFWMVQEQEDEQPCWDTGRLIESNVSSCPIVPFKRMIGQVERPNSEIISSLLNDQRYVLEISLAIKV